MINSSPEQTLTSKIAQDAQISRANVTNILPEETPQVGVMLPGTKKWIALSDALHILSKIENNGEEGQHRPKNRRPAAGFKSVGKKIVGEELVRAMIHQRLNGGLFEDILVELNLAEEEDIIHGMTAHHGFPYLPLESYEIDLSASRLVPKEVALRHGCIPIDKMGNNLTMAMSNPLNAKAIKELEVVSGCSILAFVAKSSEIKKAIDLNYPKNGE